MINLNEIQQYLDHKYPKNKGFFVFGSHIYGTNGFKSDLDILVIEDSLNNQSVSNQYDLQFNSEDHFKTLLLQCEIKSLEGFFGPYSRLKIDLGPNPIDWSNLRSSISQKASHSFVKAKKKIEVENDFYVGQKSLFHSLRILEMGIQLAKTQKISDFSQSNHYLENILKMSTWSEMNQVYKPVYNKLHSEFKAACPK